MAALRMILLSYGREAPSVTELLKLGVKQNALTERGWLHAGIAEMATGFGEAPPPVWTPLTMDLVP
ncbi:hypothetical protein [Planomonospora sp. ID82291]|uniref:hypothetical protein n=1 Tax=Planomonospora sp. ID82291 TaxID=2738136 RepID=UPI0018C3D9FD|nr:hypothetical protein [Planomonospora sp. ID82291]